MDIYTMRALHVVVLPSIIDDLLDYLNL